MNEVELLPCPFCGSTPVLGSGDGTYYEMGCDDCGIATISVSISFYMTIDERIADPFTNFRFKEEFIERAKAVAIEEWNTRVPANA